MGASRTYQILRTEFPINHIVSIDTFNFFDLVSDHFYNGMLKRPVIEFETPNGMLVSPKSEAETEKIGDDGFEG